jgi:hypothetical protein
MNRCPYQNCRYNCFDKNAHKAFYANIKSGKSKSKYEIDEKSILSPKVNWAKCTELGIKIDKINYGK